MKLSHFELTLVDFRYYYCCRYLGFVGAYDKLKITWFQAFLFKRSKSRPCVGKLSFW